MESKQQYPLAWRIGAYVVMIGFTVLMVGPLFWLGYSSLKPNAEIVRNIFSLPTQLYFNNYTFAWKHGRLGLYSVNSIFYSVTTAIVSTLLALMAGYGIAKFGYKKISGAIYVFFMMGLLLTVQSILVPLFVMESKLKILDTHIGVLLPYIAFALPFLVFLATSFVKGLPTEMEEAAIIDGASYLGVFWYIILPLSRPVIATMLIFQFLGTWNEFAMIFVITSKAAVRTLPVGINAFAGGMTRDFGTQFAALMIGTLPMLIFYALFNKQIQEGFASGALKE
jgi:raffinose/stachyose/melibiose transport system permease protein